MNNKIIIKEQVIGFVRYSQKGFYENKDRNIFDAEYFEYRYTIFNNVTLKSFQQQTNPSFILLLLHSENMPFHYKERFFDLEKENPFIYNVFIKDTQESFNEVILNSEKYISYEKDAAITFRIDNDDAVPTNFIENLSLFLNPAFVGSCINLPNILIVKRAQTNNYLVERRYFPSNSIGLAYVTSENNFKTIFDINHHHLVNEKNNLILLPTYSGMPIQTINGENAMNSINDIASENFTERKLQEFLKDNNYPNINLKCLKILKSQKRNTINGIINLLTPPIFKVILFKIHAFIMHKNNINL